MPKAKRAPAEAGLISAKTGTPVPLLGVKADVEIAGRGARTTIAQRFRNDEKTPIECVYKFPLDEAAAVCGFRAVVGDRRIDGKVEEREEAFRQYDDAMAAGDGAFLLDQERPNLFTLSVGNLNPGQEAVIEITTVALLPTHGGETRFSLPTTIMPRFVPADTPDEDGIPAADKVNPEFALDVPYGIVLTADVLGADGVESVECPSHKVRHARVNGRIRVEFSAGEAKTDRDFVLTVVRAQGHENAAWAAVSGGDVFLQADLCPEDDAAAPPPEIVFILDRSGSMQGPSITQARRALIAAISALPAGCRFNVYGFGTTFEKMSPKPLPYTEENLAAAKDWVARSEADLVTTELLPPLSDLYASEAAERSVMLITDGGFGNEAAALDLIGDNAATSRFFAVGIGSSVNAHAVRQAARCGRGASELIAPDEAIERKVLRLLGKMLGRSVADLRIDGVPAAQQAPSGPTAFRGETTTVFARVPGGAVPATVTVTGVSDGKPVSWTLPVAAAGPGTLPVPALWAREAIRDVEEGTSSFASGGSRQERRKADRTKETVVALSKEFSLASSRASFVAIERRADADKSKGDAALRKVPVMITAGWHGIDSRANLALSVQSMGGALHAFGSSGSGAGVTRGLSVPIGMQACLKSARPSGSGWGAAAGRDGGAFLNHRTADAGDALRFVSDARRTIGRATADDAGGDRGTRETADLMAVLACQRAEGGFSLDAKALKAVGASRTGLERAARQVSVPGVDGYVAVCTAIALAFLVLAMGAHSETWAPATRKSKRWLAGIVKDHAPTIDGRPLAEWAADLLSK